MIPELIKDSEEKMRKAVEATRHEFTMIRTGRANPAILDHVRVEMYGQLMPLSQIATITVSEARQLLITPFDRNALAHIEKGIQKSDVGLTPNNDGTGIRLNIPPLNEQRRKDLIKTVHGKAEQLGRASIRTVRQEIVKKVQAQKKAKENPISENEEKRAIEQIQKLVDRYTADIEQLVKAKEAELMEV